MLWWSLRDFLCLLSRGSVAHSYVNASSLAVPSLRWIETFLAIDLSHPSPTHLRLLLLAAGVLNGGRRERGQGRTQRARQADNSDGDDDDEHWELIVEAAFIECRSMLTYANITTAGGPCQVGSVTGLAGHAMAWENVAFLFFLQVLWFGGGGAVAVAAAVVVVSCG